MARPKKDINEKQVETFAAIGCTVEEIATALGCSKDTLERRFAAPIKRGRDNLKTSLRRMQIKSAQSGNVAMLIWLGKQLLDQHDRHEHTGADGRAIETHTTIDVRSFSTERLRLLESVLGQEHSELGNGEG